jgi:hypothetical protein
LVTKGEQVRFQAAWLGPKDLAEIAHLLCTGQRTSRRWTEVVTTAPVERTAPRSRHRTTTPAGTANPQRATKGAAPLLREFLGRLLPGPVSQG